MIFLLICDTHADTLYRLALHPGQACDVTASRLREGGVSLQTMALFVGGSPKIEDIQEACDKMWAKADSLKAQGLRQIDDPAQAREGESAFMLSIEGCDLLEKGLSLLSDWRQRGVRIAALTWNYENCIAVPACVDQDQGLKPLGREAVREMARLGIAPDTSHLSRRGFFDLLEMGVVPLASHSCCDALHPHKRNLTDAQLTALFQAGGYVGINFYPNFLASGGAGLDDVARHALHMLELGGEGMIGFGSDFDGIECKPAGLDNPSDFPALLNCLRSHGISESTLRGIAGENLVRYYERIK